MFSSRRSSTEMSMLDLDGDAASTREAPKAGRRVRGGLTGTTVVSGADGDQEVLRNRENVRTGGVWGAQQSAAPAGDGPAGEAGPGSESGGGGAIAPPPALLDTGARPPRSNTWDLESSDAKAKFTGVSERKRQQDEAVRTGAHASKHALAERAETNIESLETLDDAAPDDVADAVSAPAKYRAHRVPAMRDLESEAAIVRAKDGAAPEVDLSLLTALLCPSDQVAAEGDGPWDPEALLVEVASELTAEEEAAERAAGRAPAAVEEDDAMLSAFAVK